MSKSNILQYFFVWILLFLSIVVTAQVENKSSENMLYKKKELNSGFRLGWNSEREELLTDETKYYDETKTGEANFQFSNRYWKFLDYMQERLEFNFEIGSFGGYGNWIDSSSVENINADYNLFGIRSRMSIDYTNRYYYNQKYYTLVEVSGWARYDWFNQKSEGTSVDSFGVETAYTSSSTETKIRYGFEARAGWGWGRLTPMNNFMLVQYIIEKYYAGRNFSEEEIIMVASEIYRIKSLREIITGHNNEFESKLIADFLNEKLLLTPPDNLEVDWELGEFLPRLDGNRVEGGPFFKYYNREPDFIYGAFIQYDNAKYCNVKWNRNLSAGINYNRYKKDDWVLAELKIGWSYFPNLKKQIDFGVKYIPGISINDSFDSSDFNNGFVPYVGYFSQINSKSRVNFEFAYRFSKDEKLMLPGPEFSLSFYRSRY
ncbi:MAG: hypothetical protein GQ525_07260 [Draconibacterium sp.]|nr:hypothetical protein [Draconibacterium sp.]